ESARHGSSRWSVPRSVSVHSSVTGSHAKLPQSAASVETVHSMQLLSTQYPPPQSSSPRQATQRSRSASQRGVSPPQASVHPPLPSRSSPHPARRARRKRRKPRRAIRRVSRQPRGKSTRSAHSRRDGLEHGPHA